MAKIELFFQPPTRLCAHFEGDKCVLGVRPTWASPISRPGEWLAILDGKGEEIALLRAPQKELDAASWQNAQTELARRDLSAKIERIESAREESGVAYFTAQTDRGRREFVVTNLSTNVVFFGENRILLLDSVGNRFEIPDLEALGARSRALLEGIL